MPQSYFNKIKFKQNRFILDSEKCLTVSDIYFFLNNKYKKLSKQPIFFDCKSFYRWLEENNLLTKWLELELLSQKN